jgi:hypothetical protein
MSEVTQLAKNIAFNCGYHVFPCESEKKRPAISKREGGNGFHDATTDPDKITRLFSHPSAALIGLRTGETSGVSVLDVDIKHPEACAWWRKYVRYLPVTRTYRTRSGGLHMYFRHAAGVVNSEARPVKGVDVRGEGGYVIFWFAVGFECLDHSPPASWPRWLTETIWPPPPPRRDSKLTGTGQIEVEYERVREVAIQKVKDAGNGNMHYSIRAAARLLGGIQARARFSDAEATRWLMDAASLKEEAKAEKTIAWGLKKGRSEPLEIRGQ